MYQHTSGTPGDSYPPQKAHSAKTAYAPRMTPIVAQQQVFEHAVEPFDLGGQ
jgi:hypothetical protein